MKQSLLIIIITCMYITMMGCGGRNAKPIAIYQDSDLKKTCDQLELEMIELQKQADQLFPKTDKGVTNGLWGTAGMFLIVPLLGMDMKNAEKVEFEAITQRHNYLLDVAKNNSCPTNRQAIPSLEELRATKKLSKK